MMLLSVKNLNIYTKNPCKILVNNMSFQVKEGESVVLLGQSGSGKTMTCRALMSLLNSKKFMVTGSIEFRGEELISMKTKRKEKIYGGEIAFIPQNPMTALNPSMKIGKQMEETLCLHLNIGKEQRTSYILRALEQGGLVEGESILNRYPYELSGGMLQRVIISMALMVNAKLIIADEPTTALDVVHRNSIIEVLKKLKSSGATVIMVTHDFAAAAHLGGNLMVMKEGEIIENGKVDEVLIRPKHSYTKSLIETSCLWV